MKIHWLYAERLAAFGFGFGVEKWHIWLIIGPWFLALGPHTLHEEAQP